MKYVVSYMLDDASFALSFDSHKKAVDYVLSCRDAAGDNIKEFQKIDRDSYKMTLNYGRVVEIFIKKYPDKLVRFKLYCYKNENKNENDHGNGENKEFTKRELVVDYANKMIKDLGYNLSDSDSRAGIEIENENINENERGKWEFFDRERKLFVSIDLKLIIYSDKTISDYEILGVGPTASRDEIEQAKENMLSKYKNKGDRVDNENLKEGWIIIQAYTNIVNGSPSDGSNRPEYVFECADMHYFFAHFDQLKNELFEDYSCGVDFEKQRIHSDAKWLMFIGPFFALCYFPDLIQLFNIASSEQIRNKVSSQEIVDSVGFGMVSIIGLVSFIWGLVRFINSSKSSIKNE